MSFGDGGCSENGCEEEYGIVTGSDDDGFWCGKGSGETCGEACGEACGEGRPGGGPGWMVVDVNKGDQEQSGTELVHRQTQQCGSVWTGMFSQAVHAINF